MSGEYVQAAGDFKGDTTQNQLQIKAGDIIKVMPGGNEDWALGYVAFDHAEQKVMPESTALFYPVNFVVPSDWTPPVEVVYIQTLAPYNGDPNHQQIQFDEGDIL